MDRYAPRKGRTYRAKAKFREVFRKLAPTPADKPMEPRRNLMSYGPAVLGLAQGPEEQRSGPGEPPEGFVTGTTSKTEWYVYWALLKLCPPIGVEFTYQESYQGGRHIPGGSVVDFVIYMPLQTILMRVQTYRFHFTLGANKQYSDFEQKVALGDNEDMVVVDIYEQDFIDDDTGGQVLLVVLDAMNGIERTNPLATGMVIDNG